MRTPTELTGIQSWLDIHISGSCMAQPPTRDCLISLAQCIQKELTDLPNSNPETNLEPNNERNLNQ